MSVEASRGRAEGDTELNRGKSPANTAVVRVPIPPFPEPVDKRRALVQLHLHLRELIINGDLPEGAELNQVEIARAIGVSRIPVREAIRMLQQEGLVEAEPDQRARVARFGAADRDEIWASRIMLESLALRLSAGRLIPAEFDELDKFLAEMMSAAEAGNRDDYRMAHRRFHLAATAGGGVQIHRTIMELSDKAPTHLLVPDFPFIGSWQYNIASHRELIDAVRSSDRAAAGRAGGLHIGRPALLYLTHTSPLYEPRAIREALRLLDIDERALRSG